MSDTVLKKRGNKREHYPAYLAKQILFFGLQRNLENVCIPSHLFVSDAHATPPLLVACEKLCSLMDSLTRSSTFVDNDLDVDNERFSALRFFPC